MFTKVSMAVLFSCMVVSAQTNFKRAVVCDDSLLDGTLAPTTLSVSSSTDTRVYPDIIRHQVESSIAANPYYLYDATEDNTFVGFVDLATKYFYVGYGYTQGKYELTAGMFNNGAYKFSDGSFDQYEPVLAYGPYDGETYPTLYYMYLKSGYYYPYLYVKRTTDGGYSWLSPVQVAGAVYPDKPWMVVDQYTNPGNVYIAYTEFYSNPAPIYFTCAVNTNLNFSTPINISSPYTGGFSQGVSLAVGTKGEVYAVWSIYDILDDSHATEIALGFNKSTDAGLNWIGASEIVSDIYGIWGKFSKNTDPAVKVRVQTNPAIAVSGIRNAWAGNIYVVWPSKIISTSSESYIFLIKSTNNGSTWIGENGDRIDQGASPIRVNTDAIENGKDQWQPAICVDDYGVITVVFYDCRNSSTNTKTEVWAARSTDGGNAFTNFRISDAAFYLFPIYPNSSHGYWGDYISVCANGHNAIASWMDPRMSNNNGNYRYQVFVDKIDNTTADISLAPLQPIGVNVSCSPNYAPLVTWDMNMESDLQYYEVWRTINEQGGSAGTFSLIATTTTNSFEDIDLHYKSNGGWKVYYKIRVKDTQQQSSLYSEIVSTRSDGWMKQIGRTLGEANKRDGLVLNQNYPNPFNPKTTFRYSLPEDGHVQIRVFDLLGRECSVIEDKWQIAGSHQVEFEGSALSSGTYIIRMQLDQKIVAITISNLK
jgi:hypothetical protein